MSVAGLALRPVGCQRFIAIAAQDEAAQRKVLIEVTTRRYLRAPAQAALDRHEGLIVDQRFMVSLAQGDVPCLRLDHPGIDGMAQNIGNPLIRDRAVFVARKACEGFEMPFDFRLGLEAPAGKAFQPIPDDGGQGLIGDEQFTVPGDFARHPVADRRLKDPIAVFDAGGHFLDGLPPVLLALQLSLCRKDGFDELAFRRVFEFEVQAFDGGSKFREPVAQHEMEDRIAGKALQIVEDNNIIMLWVGLQMMQQGDHAGTVHEVPAPGAIIGEDRLDLMALLFSIKTTSMFLAVEAMTLRALLDVTDTAID